MEHTNGTAQSGGGPTTCDRKPHLILSRGPVIWFVMNLSGVTRSTRRTETGDRVLVEAFTLFNGNLIPRQIKLILPSGNIIGPFRPLTTYVLMVEGDLLFSVVNTRDGHDLGLPRLRLHVRNLARN